MIPKIIHYCWFGPKSKPISFNTRLASWKRYLPDYRIIEWNEGNFDISLCDYSREAYAMGNYTNVSDVCSIFSLYTYGGIYLDINVELCGNIDKFMTGIGAVLMDSALIRTRIMSAPPKTEWTEAFLSYYLNHHFIKTWGQTLGLAASEILTFKIIPKLPLVQRPKILPSEYGCDIDWQTNKPNIQTFTFVIHNHKVLLDKKKTLKEKINSIFHGIKIRYGRLDELWERRDYRQD